MQVRLYNVHLLLIIIILIIVICRKNIIATDLALYFGNQKFMTRLLENNEFDASVPTHRDTMLALMMTGADLCAIPKPWDTQEKTVDDLYHEFFQQVCILFI